MTILQIILKDLNKLQDRVKTLEEIDDIQYEIIKKIKRTITILLTLTIINFSIAIINLNL